MGTLRVATNCFFAVLNWRTRQLPVVSTRYGSVPDNASEGTLGVITEVTVRLYPLPVSAAICSFPSIEAAVRTTIQIIQLGIPIARVELIDANTVRMVNAHSKLTLREEPLLRSRDFRAGPRTWFA